MSQILLSRAAQDYPAQSPPPLRFIRSCSSSLAAPTLHKLEATFGVPVLEAYAMTEAAHQMTSNPLPKHGIRKPGSVGQPQGSVQVLTVVCLFGPLLPIHDAVIHLAAQNSLLHVAPTDLKAACATFSAAIT